MTPQKNQVEINYLAFEKKLPELLTLHRGKFALMRDEKIIDFFDTVSDAYVAGKKLFEKDQLFSIQEVVDIPVNLGIYSYAMPRQ